MKPKHILFGLLALITASCTNDDLNEVAGMKQNGIQVTAGLTADTRVSFEQDGTVTHAYWEEGDQITLYAPSQGYFTYQVSTLSEDATSATFTPVYDALQNTDETIYAAYATDMAPDIVEGLAPLPITESWIGEHPMPFAYAISNVADGKVNLSFQHIFAYLKLTLNAETVAGSTNKSVAVIGVSTTSDEPLANVYGYFYIPEQEYVIEKGSNHMYFTLEEAFTATGTAEKSVYIPILPQPAGETITINIFGDYEATDTLFTESKEVPSTGFVAGRAYTYSPKSSITRVGNTITLTEAGTLSQAISAAEKDTITSLKIIGPLNGDDIRFIREMAGVDVNANETTGKLTYLDISEASIVVGGGYYFATEYESYYTANNEIGWGMFEKTIIENIQLPQNATLIGPSAFAYSALKGITIPNGVTSIGGNAFVASASLVNVSIPEGVTEIPASAFSSCTSLTSINIPNSVTEIAFRAFNGCSSLSTIIIGNGVTSIGETAFEDCSSLSEVTCEATTPPTLGSNVFMDIAENSVLNVPSGTYSAYMASDWAQYFTTIDDGEDHGSYENGVATVITAGTLSTLIPEDEKYTITTLKVVGPLNGDDIRFIREMAGRDVYTSLTNGVLTDLDLSEATIVEGGGAYFDYSTPLTTENNVIGTNMFHSTILESIVLPNNAIAIGIQAFEKCSSLTSVTISSSISSISKSAFGATNSLTEVHISDLSAWCKIEFESYASNPMCYGGKLYLNNIVVSDLVIPSDITEINSLAFYHCSSLTSVLIHDSVVSIGDYAFCGCNNMISITIGNNVVSIGNSAFSDCSSLTSVSIPYSVTTIGDDAFGSCSSMTSVYTSDLSAWCRITFGSEGANPLCNGGKLFLDNTEVTDLVIPNDVTEIKPFAFYVCSSLTSVLMHDDIVSIGTDAFSGCRLLSSVTIGNSVTSIGNDAFMYCSSLASIIIPNNVNSIGSNAFRTCSSLSKVACNATTPPTLDSYVFYDIVSPSTLIVPTGCTTAYSESDWASYFTTIEEK